MAHTILVRLDVDDEYADIHPDITATDHLEGSKAYGWEVVTERVFTESEVRELLRGMMQLIDGDPEQVLAAIEAVNAKHGPGLFDPA